jgi:polyhydroxybutyrate depolymerase
MRSIVVLATAAVAIVASLAAGTVRVAAEESPPPEPSSGCSAERRPAVAGERFTIQIGGEERSYLLDAPASDAARPRPLILAFHGFQGSAEGQRQGDGFVELAAREELVVVRPDGHEGVRLLGSVGRGWDLGPAETRDAAAVAAMLDRVERERCIDRRRMYATGMSNGGFFSNLLGCRMADRLAAIAPVAGGMPLPPCVPARPVPVLFIVGSADDIVPPALTATARDWWAERNGCTGRRDRDGCVAFEGCAADVVYCEGAHGHSWPPDTTARIWRFFTSHPRR